MENILENVKNMNPAELWNVYNLNYLISDVIKKKSYEKKKIAVVAHVNYTDLIGQCFSYIENIPPYMDIYITTKGEQNINIIQSKIQKLQRGNIYIIVPQDRGREISGLLVACREQLKKYEYLCFVHDKKKNKGEPYLTVGQSFCDLLWENTLKNEAFIENVIDIFENNPSLGLLAPPIPYTSHFFMVGLMGWTGCFDKTKRLVQKLSLDCVINEDIPPFVLGTTFWCRTKALEPLLKYEWEYTDFEPEPMPIDNTISHAIERILPFVAQSQGYYSGWLMTPEYGSIYMANYQYMYDEILTRLNDEAIEIVAANSTKELKTNQLKKFLDKFKGFYIYGAGQKAAECKGNICDLSKFLGFIVSDNHRYKESYLGYKVYEIGQIMPDDNIGIVIAVSSKYIIDIYPELNKAGFKNIERYV